MRFSLKDIAFAFICIALLSALLEERRPKQSLESYRVPFHGHPWIADHFAIVIVAKNARNHWKLERRQEGGSWETIGVFEPNPFTITKLIRVARRVGNDGVPQLTIWLGGTEILSEQVRDDASSRFFLLVDRYRSLSLQMAVTREPFYLMDWLDGNGGANFVSYVKCETGVSARPRTFTGGNGFNSASGN